MDHHFTMRFSYAGMILLVFAALGYWAANSSLQTLFHLPDAGGGDSYKLLLTGATALIAAPVIGVILQGVVLAALRHSGRFFTDLARAEIAREYRASLRRGLRRGGGAFPPLDRDVRAGARPAVLDDSIFVLLYYSHAQPHLIEWARRRRSYCLLGLSWALASVLGLLLGAAAGWSDLLALAGASRRAGVGPAGAVAILAATACFAGYATWLAFGMKRDVDGMEWAWTRDFLCGRGLEQAPPASADAGRAKTSPSPARWRPGRPVPLERRG